MQFTGADRGQAVQVGAVLLFGVLILGLTIYQATIVPQQNRQVEFDHNQRVQNDMTNVRNAILQSAARGEATFANVKLGTTYPPRVFAINPSSPSGSLRTAGGGQIIVENATGANVTDDVCPSGGQMRFLQYEPNYNAYDRAPTTVYENTVLYNRYDSGKTLTLTGQRLVQGKTVNLLPLVGNYSRSGVGTATFEPIPGYIGGQSVTDPRIEIPTRLSESTWKDLLDGQSVGNIKVSGGKLILEFSSNRTVLCSPIGANQLPPTGMRETAAVLAGGMGGSGVGAANPSGPEATVITNTSYRTNNNTITLEFQNNDNNRNRTMSRMRIPFVSTGRNNAPQNGTVRGDPDTKLRITGDYKALNDPITIQWNKAGFDNTVEVRIKFDGSVKDEWFILSVVFSNGEQANYYVLAG